MSVNTGVCQGVNHGLGEILPPALQASLKVGPCCSTSLTSGTFCGKCMVPLQRPELYQAHYILSLS